MIILSSCIIIFVTYLAICGLLTYYFIKQRIIWDELFSIDIIWNSLRELFVCPEHFIIWLPFIDFENTKCVEKRQACDDTRIKIKKVLEYIRNNIIDIRDVGNGNIGNGNSSNGNVNGNGNGNSSNGNNICNIEKIKWIIEGTMKDFDRMYDEKAEFYIKLADSYDILYDKMNLKHNSNTCLLLEDLVILENNIEICDNILNVLSVFYENNNNNDDDDDYDDDNNYKLLFQIESGYMSLFIYNLIENIKMYKIMCMSKF